MNLGEYLVGTICISDTEDEIRNIDNLYKYFTRCVWETIIRGWNQQTK